MATHRSAGTPDWIGTSLYVVALSCLVGCAGAIAAPLDGRTSGSIGNAADGHRDNPMLHASFGDVRVRPLPRLPKRAPVAVWPGIPEDAGLAQSFASKISARFDVMGPGVTQAIIHDANLDADLHARSNGELATRFTLVCKRTGSAMLFAERPVNDKAFDMLVFDCRSDRIAFDERLTLVGALAHINRDQALQYVGNAWATRILEAVALGETQR